MWIALCDENKNPIHPSVIGWVDLDLISWRFISDPEERSHQLLAVNKDNVCFPIHQNVRHPRYFALFREIDDTMPQSPVAPLACVSDTVVTSKYQIVAPPGWMVVRIDFTDKSSS